MGKHKKKHKPMTKGERLVWAATFSQELKAKLSYERQPSYLHRPDNDKERDEWYRAQVTSAVEAAWGAVNYLRKSVPDVIEGFGEPSDPICGDVTAMLLEMTDG